MAIFAFPLKIDRHVSVGRPISRPLRSNYVWWTKITKRIAATTINCKQNRTHTKIKWQKWQLYEHVRYKTLYLFVSCLSNSWYVKLRFQIAICRMKICLDHVETLTQIPPPSVSPFDFLTDGTTGWVRICIQWRMMFVFYEWMSIGSERRTKTNPFKYLLRTKIKRICLAESFSHFFASCFRFIT